MHFLLALCSHCVKLVSDRKNKGANTMTLFIILSIVIVAGTLKLKPESKEYKTSKHFHNHVTSSAFETLR